MKKYIILALVLILAILFFVARCIENADSNHKRYRSNSINESNQNNLLWGKYRLLGNQDSLFFTIQEAWVEKLPLYIDDIFSKINSTSQNFIIKIEFKKGEKYTNNNYSQSLIFEMNDSFAESQGKYLTFFKPTFPDRISVKVIATKDSFNLNNKENEVLETLEFEKIK